MKKTGALERKVPVSIDTLGCTLLNEQKRCPSSEHLKTLVHEQAPSAQSAVIHLNIATSLATH